MSPQPRRQLRVDLPTDLCAEIFAIQQLAAPLAPQPAPTNTGLTGAEERPFKMQPMILASRSPARADLLRAAGVTFEAIPAAIDETAVMEALLAEHAPARDVADTLAEMKARRVGGRRPGRLVLGADQVLVCGARIYDKPEDLDAAAQQLRALRGRTHELYSAAVIVEDAQPVWRHVGRAQLTMRPFSNAFLEAYLAGQGAALLDTVGGYRIEAGGAPLFSRVQGDWFSVLGLPLLEVLGYLRARGLCLE